jgi:DNA-binding NarL/FixJ family response regulator
MSTTVRYDSPGREADVATRSAALRIMLVDDHPIVRRGLRDLLADAFTGAIISEVGSGREAIAALHSNPWNVIVLDLSLPDGSGLDVLKRVRELRPRLPVLILSVHAADHFAPRAIAAGASGYLTKDAADVELVSAVSKAGPRRQILRPRCARTRRARAASRIATIGRTNASQTANIRCCG